MALNSITTNIAAYSAQSNINAANSKVAASVSRLSSGQRISRASDDVAALSIGTTLRTQVNTLKVGLTNAAQGSSLLQVADGALGKVTEMLTRMKALATQANSGSLGSAERGFLNQEFQSLSAEIDRVTQTTNFNGVKLLDGTIGGKSILAATGLIAATFTAGGGNAASTSAIEAFNLATGATAQGTAAGQLQFVDSANAALTNGAFLNVNTAVSGKIGKFELSNLVEGVSATLKTTINGVEFTGTVANAGTSFVLTNGSTRIQFGTAAFTATTSGTAQNSLSALNTAFANVSILRTQQVTGVNFTGTALAGVSGAGASGTPMIRIANTGNTGISNFTYVSNAAANNTNVLSVNIGGRTFTATAVNDAVAAGDQIRFADGSQEGLVIDLTGLTTGIGNIRTNMTDRNNFINALNTAFASAAGGVDFAVGAAKEDKISVKIASATTSTLFAGQSLNIATQSDATNASGVIDGALRTITAVRAEVGSQMARFDYTSANLEIAVQNQDAARGVLLDTDVAAESTAYANTQVQLQAGISVLAQANQLTQNLLKLVG